MKNTVRGGRIFSEENSVHGLRFGRLRNTGGPGDEDYPPTQDGNDSSVSPLISPPENNSPFQFSSSPLNKSPWSLHHSIHSQPEQSSASTNNYATNALIGSLVREEGHIYSLAAFGDLLYTGSDSKNIRVWKNQKEFSGFKSNSGLVKAIVISNDQNIFTGHQDGKIRVWKISAKNPTVHKRIGTLPTLKAYIKSSIKPSNYVEVRRKRNAIWIKHFDAISCLSLNEDQTFLYSGSWDKSFKVWRISDSKCLESINAHDDAVNSVVAGFDGLVFTGSADGTVKVWRRELQGKGTKHFFSQTLLKQECAVTALAINPNGTFVYCGSSDGLVNFWEKEKNLSHGGVLRGHKLAVLCLAANGNLVFSGSADMGICAWQRVGSDHACLFVLTGHTGPVKCLAVEEDSGLKDGDRRQHGWILYSGSLDKSVKMWRVLEREVSELQQVIGMQKQEQNYNNSSNSDGYATSTTPSFNSSSPLNQNFSFHSRTSQNSLNRRY